VKHLIWFISTNTFRSRNFGFDDILKRGAYLTFKSIFHNALKLFYFDCQIKVVSVPGTNQY